MINNTGTHPLLAQIPLTVSPFVSLPTAATLPYTYKPMPSTLPPSSSGITTTTSSADADPTSTISATDNKPRYVVSASGHAAHPDDIIASCRALQSHVAAMQADAERELADLDRRVRDRELAEKRRVAPGWLDSSARLLEPEKKAEPPSEAGADTAAGGGVAGQFAEMSLADRQGACEMAGDLDQGAELDRAFGGK